MKKEYISHNKQNGWEPTKYRPDIKTRMSKVSIVTSHCLSTQKNKSQIYFHIPVSYHRGERGHGDKVPGIQYFCITSGLNNLYCAPTVLPTKVKAPSATRVAMAV